MRGGRSPAPPFPRLPTVSLTPRQALGTACHRGDAPHARGLPYSHATSALGMLRGG